MADFPSIFSSSPGGGSSASAFVGCRVTNSTDLTLSDNTDTRVLWNTETYDTSGIHEGVTNPGRMTIPSGKDGYWFITVSASFQLNASGLRALWLYKNGSRVQPGGYSIQSGAAQTVTCTFTEILSLVATDYLEIFAYQNRGGTLDLRLNSDGAYFIARYLGA